MLDALFDKGAQLLGAGVTGDQLKLVFSIFSSYFFAWIYTLLPARASTKHLFSVIVTLMTMLGLLKMYSGFLHITLTSLFTYLCMKYNRSPSGPWLNFVVVMTSMSACHIDRQFKGNSGDTTLDYSGMMMIATIKLTMYGFNVLDGRRQQGLTAYNEQMKISSYPTLLEYFGWLFFFGGYLVGPSCEYMDYIRFTHLDDKARRQLPSPAKPALMIVARSLLFIAILVTCGPKYNFDVLLKAEWESMPYLKRLAFIQVVAFVSRCKYYAVWLLSEGACVLCGFGFNGYDDKGRAKWDRLTNINVARVELAQSLKEYGDNWNMATNRWLKHYVYLRVTPPNKKAGMKSSLVTYFVSALWHGFYPGYYIMFLSLALFQTLGRSLRRCLRPLALAPDGRMPLPLQKSVYDMLGTVVTVFIVNVTAMSFVGLYLQPVLHIWHNVYYIHYILGIATFGLLKVVYRPLIALQKKRAHQSGYISKSPDREPKAKDVDVTEAVGIDPPPADPIVVKEKTR
ncbi:MBOAT, membrane-bound O-acyltransferase family-domain-containing protein [Gongronella butleri]|nr:MBOAT, membrane-bound O-acyltransferase family-domain-containing protein [Gongronella butleri]